MNAILYGNIRAEIVSGAGVRLQRFTLRRSTPYLPSSRPARSGTEAADAGQGAGGSRRVRGCSGGSARWIPFLFLIIYLTW